MANRWGITPFSPDWGKFVPTPSTGGSAGQSGDWAGTVLGRGGTSVDNAKVDFYHQWGKDVRGSVRLTGVNKLLNQLAGLRHVVSGKDIVAMLKDAGMMQKTAVQNRIRSMGLIKTGALLSSIFMDARDPFHDARGPSVLVGINSNIAPHWHFIELGTRTRAAHPFFRPAMQATKATASKMVATRLEGLIKAAVR